MTSAGACREGFDMVFGQWQARKNVVCGHAVQRLVRNDEWQTRVCSSEGGGDHGAGAA